MISIVLLLLFVSSQAQTNCHHNPLSNFPQTTTKMFRQTFTRNVRLFSTSVRVQKSAVDAAKEAAKNVDKTVSQTLVKGIEGAGKLHNAPY